MATRRGRQLSGVRDDVRMIISGGYNGGYVSDPAAVVDPGYVDLTVANAADLLTRPRRS